jgi:hypothetical protein
LLVHDEWRLPRIHVPCQLPDNHHFNQNGQGDNGLVCQSFANPKAAAGAILIDRKELERANSTICSGSGMAAL